MKFIIAFLGCSICGYIVHIIDSSVISGAICMAIGYIVGKSYELIDATRK